MELWFSEPHTPNVKLSIRVDKQLYSGQSEFQRIDVFESPEFGRFLVLDGYVMLTEKDEFIYHEMIVHVPMAVHPNVRRVLVIGAGDGGAIRELTRYPEIEHIDLVEIDEQVVQVCREYLPSTAGRLGDERVHIHYEDGLKYVRFLENEYDLIIVDSTDPFGPGEGLFTKEFYGNCYKALKEDGIMVNQHESPFYEADATACMRAHKRIVEHTNAYGSSATHRKEYVGKITNYFKNIGVAEITVEASTLAEGDDILIMGETTGVVEQKAEGIVLDNKVVAGVKQGDVCSIKTVEVVRRGDKLYKEVLR